MKLASILLGVLSVCRAGPPSDPHASGTHSGPPSVTPLATPAALAHFTPHDIPETEVGRANTQTSHPQVTDEESKALNGVVVVTSSGLTRLLQGAFASNHDKSILSQDPLIANQDQLITNQDESSVNPVATQALQDQVESTQNNDDAHIEFLPSTHVPQIDSDTFGLDLSTPQSESSVLDLELSTTHSESSSFSHEANLSHRSFEPINQKSTLNTINSAVIDHNFIAQLNESIDLSAEFSLLQNISSGSSHNPNETSVNILESTHDSTHEINHNLNEQATEAERFLDTSVFINTEPGHFIDLASVSDKFQTSQLGFETQLDSSVQDEFKFQRPTFFASPENNESFDSHDRSTTQLESGFQSLSRSPDAQEDLNIQGSLNDQSGLDTQDSLNVQDRFIGQSGLHAQGSLNSQSGLDAQDSLNAQDGLDAHDSLNAQDGLDAQDSLNVQDRLDAQGSLNAQDGLEPQGSLNAQDRLDAQGSLNAQDGLEPQESLDAQNLDFIFQEPISTEQSDTVSQESKFETSTDSINTPIRPDIHLLHSTNHQEEFETEHQVSFISKSNFLKHTEPIGNNDNFDVEQDSFLPIPDSQRETVNSRNIDHATEEFATKSLSALVSSVDLIDSVTENVNIFNISENEIVLISAQPTFEVAHLDVEEEAQKEFPSVTVDNQDLNDQLIINALTSGFEQINVGDTSAETQPIHRLVDNISETSSHMISSNKIFGSSLSQDISVTSNQNLASNLLQDTLVPSNQNQGSNLLQDTLVPSNQIQGSNLLQDTQVQSNQNLGSNLLQDTQVQSNQNQGSNLLQDTLVPSNQNQASNLLQDTLIPSNQNQGSNLLQDTLVPSNQNQASNLLQDTFVPSNQNQASNLLQDTLVPSNQNQESNLLQDTLVQSNQNQGSNLLQDTLVQSNQNLGSNLLQDTLVPSNQNLGSNLLQDTLVLSNQNLGSNLLQDTLLPSSQNFAQNISQDRLVKVQSALTVGDSHEAPINHLSIGQFTNPSEINFSGRSLVEQSLGSLIHTSVSSTANVGKSFSSQNNAKSMTSSGSLAESNINHGDTRQPITPQGRSISKGFFEFDPIRYPHIVRAILVYSGPASGLRAKQLSVNNNVHRRPSDNSFGSSSFNAGLSSNSFGSSSFNAGLSSNSINGGKSLVSALDSGTNGNLVGNLEHNDSHNSNSHHKNSLNIRSFTNGLNNGVPVNSFQSGKQNINPSFTGGLSSGGSNHISNGDSTFHTFSVNPSVSVANEGGPNPTSFGIQSSTGLFNSALPFTPANNRQTVAFDNTFSSSAQHSQS